MKKLVVFIFLGIAFIAKGQNDTVPPAAGNTAEKNIIRLKTLLRTAKADTTRILLTAKLASNYAYTRTDSGIIFGKRALLQAQQLKFTKGEVTALLALGEVTVQRGEYAGSLTYELKAIQLAGSINDQAQADIGLLQNAYGYGATGNYQRALDCLNQIKARRWPWENRQNFWKEVADLWTADAFEGLNKTDSGAYYLQQAYRIDRKNQDNWWPVYSRLAKNAAKEKQYKKAIAYVYPFGRNMGLNIDVLYRNDALADYYLKIGMPDSALYFARKSLVLQKKLGMYSGYLYASQILAAVYHSRGNSDSAYKYQAAELAEKDSLFGKQKTNAILNATFNEQQRKEELAKAEDRYQSQIRIYWLSSVLFVILVVGGMIWRNYQKQKHTNQQLNEQKEQITRQRDELGNALKKLKSTQAQLIQSEKMASLGELTAGIAHEIQNPLNFVNNFSEVNAEMLGELEEELKIGNTEEALSLVTELKQNEEKIIHHGKRADSIVKGMLEHSRASSGQKEPTGINALADEYLRLAYHGLRAKDKSFNAELITHFDEKLPLANVVPQDVGRVMLNLFNNAFYAVNQKAKTAGRDYKPMVEVNSSVTDGQIIINVKDNGNGIPENIKDKIMQPFFTTKPTGEGTGLGLSLTYDMVVKGHGGSMQVNSVEGEGSEFIIHIPVN